MGYQQSFLQFGGIKELRSELKRYVQRNTESDQAYVLCVNKTLKNIKPFVKGELMIVIGGERFTQRNKQRVKEELGIENIRSIVFIDNQDYCYLSNGNLGEFLDEHFESLSKEEIDKLLI